MNRRLTLALHYVLRAALTGGFAAYIVHLVRSDKLLYYIAPRMELYVKLAAIALSVVAVCFLFSALRSLTANREACDCEHEPSPSPLRNTAIYVLFAAPLLLGWLLPDTILGSNLVDKKGIVLSGSGGSDSAAAAENTRDPGNAENAAGAAQSEAADSNRDGAAAPSPENPQQSAGHSSLFETDDLYAKSYVPLAERLFAQDTIVVEEAAFLESITAIDLFANAFRGKLIAIEGFVYRQDDMTDTQFVVARLAMDCCSADAMPYGFLVEWPDAAKLTPDSWVRVTGRIGTSDYGGMEIVTLAATQVAHIASPETPYVYPNYDLLAD